MKLQVLVSTMHQKDHDLIKKMRISTDAVIINQCETNRAEEFNYNSNEITWVNTTDRGVSKSRNCAILNSDADICLIADDDLVYRNNYNKILMEEFTKDSSLDVIAFCVKGIEGEFKKYSGKPRNVNFLNSMRISAVEIAFRLEKIKKECIVFNEAFGPGAKYYMGEDSIFLTDCLKKGLKIKYIPKYIADLHLGDSTWFEGYNERYFFNKGAAFAAMSRGLSFFLIIQFALRKRNLYSGGLNMTTAIKLMMRGREGYLIDTTS